MADRADLEAGYREMAADHEREADAEEWCEGLVEDAYQSLSGGE
jgi:hypothetical protein